MQPPSSSESSGGKRKRSEEETGPSTNLWDVNILLLPLHRPVEIAWDNHRAEWMHRTNKRINTAKQAGLDLSTISVSNVTGLVIFDGLTEQGLELRSPSPEDAACSEVSEVLCQVWHDFG